MRKYINCFQLAIILSYLTLLFTNLSVSILKTIVPDDFLKAIAY